MRPVLLALGFWAAASAGAQDLGRTDQLWRAYLTQTVQRGLTLVPAPNEVSSSPFWPALDKAAEEALSLENSADARLIAAWIDLRSQRTDRALAALRQAWPSPEVVRFPVRRWGQTLFAAWSPAGADPAWTKAWLAWDDKVYSPSVLVRGLEVLEGSDPSAVVPLLGQALELYPEDRRFLPLVARHPQTAVQAEGLLRRDLQGSGGLSRPALRALLDRQPAARDLLQAAGYPDARLEAAVAGDYGWWLRGPGTALLDGVWTWDADADGVAESTLLFQAGQPVAWSRRQDGGSLWTLTWRQGQPDEVRESRSGSRWTLRYEAYPWAATLDYEWDDQRLRYRFRPLAQPLPLWPAERWNGAPARLPASLATLWTGLNAGELVRSAASFEVFQGEKRRATTSLFRGEVWLATEDSDGDGRDDVWSFYRGGRLASQYHDPEGTGTPNLRELYRQGELDQVQLKAAQGARTEFVLFPRDGVQLWDPQGRGRPLDRVFLWPEGDRVSALVFSGSSLPWQTMPLWEPKP